MPITGQIEGPKQKLLADLFAVLHNISSVSISKLAHAITPVILFPPVVSIESLSEVSKNIFSFIKLIFFFQLL